MKTACDCMSMKTACMKKEAVISGGTMMCYVTLYVLVKVYTLIMNVRKFTSMSKKFSFDKSFYYYLYVFGDILSAKGFPIGFLKFSLRFSGRRK